MDYIKKGVICQLENLENLICPAMSIIYSSGCETFAEYIRDFTEACEVLVTIRFVESCCVHGQRLVKYFQIKKSVYSTNYTSPYLVMILGKLMMSRLGQF